MNTSSHRNKVDYAVGKQLLKNPREYLKVLDKKIATHDLVKRPGKTPWIHEMAVGRFLRRTDVTRYVALYRAGRDWRATDYIPSPRRR